MSRAWPRLALLAATVAASGVGAGALLVDDEPGGTTPKPIVRTFDPPRAAPTPAAASESEPAYGGGSSVAGPTSARAPVVITPPVVEAKTTTPKRVNDVTLAAEPADLTLWVQDPTLEPTLRYSALRRLEALAPAEAVTAAIAALNDAAPLVRLNAIAVLSRHDDPRAKEALTRIDSKSQRLAQALVARR